MSSTKDFTPREGQSDLIKYLPQIKRGRTLSVQWPTGYGKSIGFALAWKHCFESGIANRLLMVVANDAQRKQIENDFAEDCSLVGAPNNGGVYVFQRSASDYAAASKGHSLIFVCTVQQLFCSYRGGLNTIKDMLTAPGLNWMIGFDEFHHYGDDMPWGECAKLAMEHAAFSLAMSATPYRRVADVVFPEPSMVVSYTDAVNERTVKPMMCVAYDYQVTVVDRDGDATSYTTSELLDVAPEGLDTWQERKGIRFSPQYIHPLLVYPITRLWKKRAETGLPLQMIVRAMSCEHAKLVCEQVKILAGDLSVDWVGTGERGRPEADNRSVLQRFCPPKLNKARPDPKLDILVQVSMAGEGLDSINVAEIVDLFPVSKKSINGLATQDKQFYGRGSRVIRKSNGEIHDVILHVNVPTDHPLHVWGGSYMHDWMDARNGEAKPKPEPPGGDGPHGPDDWPELPPASRECSLISVSKDEEKFIRFKEEACRRRGYDPVADEDELFNLYKFAATGVANQQSYQARQAQVKDYINGAVGKLAMVRAKHSNEIAKSVVGRFKKEINTSIKRAFGKSREEMTVDELESVANWVRSQIQTTGGLGL